MKKIVEIILGCICLLPLLVACTSPENTGLKLTLDSSDYANGKWTLVTKSYGPQGFENKTDHFSGDTIIEKEISFDHSEFTISKLYFISNESDNDWRDHFLLYVTSENIAQPEVVVKAQTDSLKSSAITSQNNGANAALTYFNKRYGDLLKELWFKKTSFELATEVWAYFEQLNHEIDAGYTVGDKLSDFLDYRSLIGYLDVCKRSGIDFAEGPISPKTMLKKFDTPYFLFVYGSSQSLNQVIEAVVPTSGSSTANLSRVIEFLIEQFNSVEIRQEMIAFYFNAYIVDYTNASPEIFEKDIKEIKGVLDKLENKAFAQQLLADFQKIKYTFRGSEVPNITLLDVKGQELKLADLFDGKNYVYIDLWATWCVPCVKEIPYLKEIEEKYKEQNIRFVSISVDATKNIWLNNGIKRYDLEGEQYLDKGAEILKNFNIVAIPRFLFYDPEGNWITMDAPRPSNPALDKMLAPYLNKKE